MKPSTLKVKNPNYNPIVFAIKNNYIMQVFFGISLLFLCSQIVIPLKPVPITLQTVAVMFLGLTYSRKAAISSIAGYLLLGILGLPIFCKFSSGFSCISGITGGYLVGFLLAVAVMATIAQKLPTSKTINSFLVATIGQVIIYACGIFWFSQVVDLKTAITFGLLPFILPGICKIIMLITLLRATWHIIKAKS